MGLLACANLGRAKGLPERIHHQYSIRAAHSPPIPDPHNQPNLLGLDKNASRNLEPHAPSHPQPHKATSLFSLPHEHRPSNLPQYPHHRILRHPSNTTRCYFHQPIPSVPSRGSPGPLVLKIFETCAPPNTAEPSRVGGCAATSPPGSSHWKRGTRARQSHPARDPHNFRVLALYTPKQDSTPHSAAPRAPEQPLVRPEGPGISWHANGVSNTPGHTPSLFRLVTFR